MNFWSYFRETLRFPLLFSPGPLSVFVEGLARTLDSVRQDILWLRAQFSPATCDDQFLVYFGDARGVRQHRLETVAQFRVRVCQAYAWQLLGGKAAGLPKILAHYGYAGASFVNLRHEDPSRWAEFRVEHSPQGPLSAADYEVMDWLIEEHKAARSRLASVRIQMNAAGNTCVALSTEQSAEVSIVYPCQPQDIECPCCVMRCGVGGQVLETVIISPRGEEYV